MAWLNIPESNKFLGEFIFYNFVSKLNLYIQNFTILYQRFKSFLAMLSIISYIITIVTMRLKFNYAAK